MFIVDRKLDVFILSEIQTLKGISGKIKSNRRCYLTCLEVLLIFLSFL